MKNILIIFLSFCLLGITSCGRLSYPLISKKSSEYKSKSKHTYPYISSRQIGKYKRISKPSRPYYINKRKAYRGKKLPKKYSIVKHEDPYNPVLKHSKKPGKRVKKCPDNFLE